jgi:hypothetical protein
MIGDLTTLARAKIYLGISDSSADAVLANLVTTQSRFFKSQVADDLIFQKYVETRDGNGSSGIDPYHQPLQRVDLLVVDGVTIPAAPATVAGDPPQYGWVTSKGRVEIQPTAPIAPDYGDLVYGDTKYRFTRGVANVVLTYWAGFYESAEAATIPATPFQVQTQESFVADYGVTRASNGTALTKVASAPAAGQYSVNATGLYTFAAADVGLAVLIAYSFVPADIEQAVWELVAWRYRERDRIAQRSKGVGGETVFFQTDGIPPTVKPTIDQYARVQV